MWITDPKTKEKSVTLTVFMLSVLIGLGKLALSGVSFGGLSFSVFSGMEYAALVTASGTIYWGRRNANFKKGE